MSDGLSWTPGSGATIATDDCGAGGHAQLFKLAISADGSATLISATADGLFVQGSAAHNVAVSGNPLYLGAYASAAAPSDVGADGRAVHLWALRNGALAVNLTAAGTLIASGAGTAATALRTTFASDDPVTVSVQIMDDWDESDRAKVNVIVGQAGIAAGAGAVAATVPRVTLASDDPAVASLGVMDDWDESDRAKVNPIVGQAGIQGNTGVVSATTIRVTLATDVALPAGTNAIGKLAANSGVDIGDVDVTSIVPGTGATNLGKAEDGGHTTGDVGVMPLGVRNDANAALSSNDLDYTPLSTDSSGNQNVNSRKPKTLLNVQSGGLTTSSTAYTAGDQVGNEFTLANAARASGGSGMIVGVSLLDVTDIIGAYDVVISDSSLTPASDNAAFAISDADAAKVVAIIQLGGAFDIGNNRLAQLQNLAIPYVCSGGTSLYATLICRVGHTFFAAATDLRLKIWVEPD